MGLVVGVDAGASSSRCVLATLDGEVVSRGSGGGANFRSSAGDPAGNIGLALTTALQAAPAGARQDVVAGVLGLAGAAAAGHPRLAAAANRAWEAAELPGKPVVVTDHEVAFAAGSVEPDGLLVISGTGAIAAAVRDFTVVARADGYGWLIGDEGSAFWLGQRGLRAAVAAIDGRGDPTILSSWLPAAVLRGTGREGDAPTAAGRARDKRDELVQAMIDVVYRQSPAEIARLAPLVDRAAAAGDPVASMLCVEAAHRLILALDAVRPALEPAGDRATSEREPERELLVEGTPRPNSFEQGSLLPTRTTVVVSGAVARGPGVVASLLAEQIRGRYGAEPRQAADGAAGAAALALRTLHGDRAETAAAHRRLIAA